MLKNKLTKLSALLLAALMLAGSFTACGNSQEDEETKAPTSADTSSGSTGENETDDPDKVLKDALAALGEIDYDGRDFTVLYADSFENEVVGVKENIESDSGNSQIVNDAVYNRNSLLEDRCNLTFAYIKRDDSALSSMVTQEATASTGDFQLIDARLGNTAGMATNNYLYDLNDMGVSFEGIWWDSGTADFVLKGGVYFMSGSLNFGDDGVTYVLIFNKDLQKTYANTVPNPYETVRNGEWTLAYFNEVIQGISRENGDSKWDELDTYGFISTWEYGNTFFIGSDLRYVLNDASAEEPSLFLGESGRKEKAIEVLGLARSIYHHNHAMYMSPPGQEGLGLTAFKESRGLFFGEVVNHLKSLNQEMKGDFGIIPVPKYDKAQEFYRTWTHGSGSTFSATSAIPDKDKETIGNIITAYAILSHQYIKPAYYDTVLTSQTLRDPDSAEMMDLIFQNRVYDMAFYFDLGFYDLFKKSVNDNSDAFVSSYDAQATNFKARLARIMRNLKD